MGYVFLDDALVDIDHIYCLAHVRAKFVTAYNIGKVNEAKPFIDWIAELYKLERHYKTLKLTPDEIKQRRNNKETSEIINKIRLELDRLWPDNKQEQSKLDPIFATVLRYLHNQWDGLMRYRDDGEYSIDNNIAERKCTSVHYRPQEYNDLRKRGRHRVRGYLPHHHPDLPDDGSQGAEILTGVLQKVLGRLP